MRKVERKVGRKFEPFSIWKLATTELKLNYPEAQKTHFAPKNSLRENSEKRETSRKIREKFEKNSRAVFQNYECCKNHCGHKINSEYSLRLRSSFALYSPYIILLMNSKKTQKTPFKNSLCIILRLSTQREKYSHIHIKRLRHQGKSEGNQEEWSRSGAVESTEWAQSADRTSCIPSALLSWTPLLLSCSPEFFYFFLYPKRILIKNFLLQDVVS